MERGEDRQKFRGRGRKRGIETNIRKGGTSEVVGGGVLGKNGCKEGKIEEERVRRRK